MTSQGPEEIRLAVALTAGEVERIALRAAELVTARRPEERAPRYLTVREAADSLRCSRQRVYDLLSQGTLTRLKDGARVLVARAEVDAYLAGAPTGRFRRPRTARSGSVTTPSDRPAEGNVPNVFPAGAFSAASSPPRAKKNPA